MNVIVAWARAIQWGNENIEQKYDENNLKNLLTLLTKLICFSLITIIVLNF